jgi:sugar lactone lactonase YvrE
MMRTTSPSVCASLLVMILVPLGLSGCAVPKLQQLGSSEDLQWTGIALSSDGRLFVNYPRWSDRYAFAVAEIIDEQDPSGVRQYPDAATNDWSRESPTTAMWLDRFVGVQSVHIDRQGRMWVLDTGEVDRSAGRQAVVYEIDVDTNMIVRALPLSFDVAPEGSYINDIRLTPDGRWAFISDSGLGAIIVMDTTTGTFRRVLADHPSTKGNADRIITIDDRPWLFNETGEPFVVHCDGIAVSPDARWVYFKAISADPLYRVPVELLVNDRIGTDQLAGSVETLGDAPITDAMIFDDAGNLYFSALEHNAIIYRTPEGTYRDLVRDPIISWPDSFAIDREHNRLVFTTAQIHRTPNFSEGSTLPDEPYRVFSYPLADTP